MKGWPVIITILTVMTVCGQPPTIDVNQNGLDDIWEQVFDASGVSPNGDPDGDGIRNRDEARAGTNPFDPTSRLNVEEFRAPDGSVYLAWDGLLGRAYTVESSLDLTDWSPVTLRMSGTGARMGVQLPVRPETGGQLLYQKFRVPEYWNYETIEQVFQAGHATSFPEEQRFISSVQFPDSNSDDNGYYIQVRALLTPPRTGNYQFYLSTGEVGEFWLSTNEDPAKASLVSNTEYFTNPGAFGEQDGQTSAEIPLVAGQTYYMALRFFEIVGPDHVELHWSGPGISRRPLPPSALEPFETIADPSKSFLRIAAVAIDTDGDEVDDWGEIALGYNPTSPKSFRGIADRMAIEDELGGGLSPVFVASVRARPPFTSASGSGLASLIMAPNDSSATVDFRFTHNMAENLSVGIYMIPAGGGQPSLVYDTPDTSFTGETWTFGSSRAAVLAALAEGRLFFQVGSGAGAWNGTFESVLASRSFTPHPEPPALPAGTPTRAEAVRFLNQATFGATESSIQRVRQVGYEAWIDEQFALPMTLQEPEPEVSVGGYYEQVWWKNALTAPDQLRMRMAFALSQVIPVNPESIIGDQESRTVGRFYDHFSRNAFGNYENLLRDMTLSPIMGSWLTYVGNAPSNPILGIRPDENYAREIMQLFSVGLVQLHPDGSVILGRDGIPQATYGQATVEEMARVFTGWGWSMVERPNDSFFFGAADYFNNMEAYPGYHDSREKVILNGVLLPAGQSAEKDLEDTLDVLMAHPSTAPFVSRLLIQRFTTSNPSPGYIQRVSEVFVDNGNGLRGDMQAVLKAILLDHDARSSDVASLPGSGKVKEPIMRWTQIFRAFDLQLQPNAPNPPDPPVFPFRFMNVELGQAPLRSPTVFNFFSPDFSPARLPGRANLQESGLVSPELELLTESVAVSSINEVLETILFGYASFNTDLEVGLAFQSQPDHPLLDLAVPGNTAGLIDHLDTLLLAGSLLPSTRSIVRDAVDHPNHEQTAMERLKTAIFLIAASPEHAVQP